MNPLHHFRLKFRGISSVEVFNQQGGGIVCTHYIYNIYKYMGTVLKKTAADSD